MSTARLATEPFVKELVFVTRLLLYAVHGVRAGERAGHVRVQVTVYHLEFPWPEAELAIVHQFGALEYGVRRKAIADIGLVHRYVLDSSQDKKMCGIILLIF